VSAADADGVAAAPGDAEACGGAQRAKHAKTSPTIRSSGPIHAALGPIANVICPAHPRTFRGGGRVAGSTDAPNKTARVPPSIEGAKYPCRARSTTSSVRRAAMAFPLSNVSVRKRSG
jgi:hypothetical protein